jgi:uncharacterized protein YdaU (DUF1376 family)
MADFPALPLWTDSYLADTRHLSTLEHGAYLLLLMDAWRRPHCDLPDDDRILARLAGLSASEWEAVKPVVMALWKYDGRRKTWTQKRLSKERAHVTKTSRSQKDKAVKRWSKPKNIDAAAMPEGMPNACPGDAPTPIPNTLPNGKGGEPPNLAERLWSDGLAVVVASGVPEKHARSLLGKWRKMAGDAGVLALLADTQQRGTSDLVPWMEAAVRNRERVVPLHRETREEREKREREEWVERNYGPESPRAQKAGAGE